MTTRNIYKEAIKEMMKACKSEMDNSYYDAMVYSILADVYIYEDGHPEKMSVLKH